MIPKFRAWDKDEKVMRIVNEIHFTIKTITCEPLKGHDNMLEMYDPICFEGHFELMQSTGLKDKNGVEIFEGDVVRYTWDMLSDVNATEKGKKVRISKVFWSDWRALWAVGEKCCNNDLFRYVRNGNTVEVIGNIYENPEFLEVE